MAAVSSVAMVILTLASSTPSGNSFTDAALEKCRRPILPYKEPAATKQNILIKFGPAEYYRDHWERVLSYERIGFAPYASKEERNATQPIWKRQTPKPNWAIKALAKLKAEHATLFWSDDNLSNYEI